jgi:hypothetical protein
MKIKAFCLAGILLVIIIGIIALPSLSGAASRQGCQFQGTWYGFLTNGTLGWTINVQGSSSSSGINNLDYPSFDPKLGVAFPNAIRVTTLRGSWERVGGNTFAFTMLGMALDENNSTVWTGKLSGTNVLSDDCNTEYIENTLEVFLPTQDPFIDEPYFAIPLIGHYGYRAKVDPPAEF